MARSQKNEDSKPRRPSKDVMVLRELDQIKVMADPLRVRILGALAEERTTKQVAELIGEKPTKLYHHVEAMEKVGLIERTRTRQNRGTLEKYFIAVALSFRADPEIFAAEKPGTDELAPVRSMVSTILDSTTTEIMQCIDHENAVESLQSEGLLSFVEVRAETHEIVELRKRLQDVLDWLVSIGDSDTDPEDPSLERFRLTIAYFPLKRTDLD